MTIRLLSASIAMLFIALAPVSTRRAIELENATIADFNAAFNAGTLTSEKLTALFLARINAYDRRGPSLHAMIAVNPKALDTARALDAERKSKGPRSQLHGIPVVLKDNFDTMDMPTTGGSVLLEGSIPPDDAFLVRKLRAAGVVIIGKANLSEFASGGAYSSLGGHTLNPHDPTRSPSGSSGGTGVAVAAAYAVVGLGTDTGGSVRGPSAANGVVGLKPTHGLLSRDGIIPLALTFDTAGPMARSVSDVAAVLGVMTGVDSADAATSKSEGRFETDYTKYLTADALKGARIGVARDFVGNDQDVDWVFEAALESIRRAGATVVDVRYPNWLLTAKDEFYNAIRRPEFTVQVGAVSLDPGPEISQDAGADDRTRERVHGDARRWRGPESEPLDAVQARSRERNDGRLSIHVGPRPRSAAHPCCGRWDPHIAETRRDRLPDGIAAAAAGCRGASSGGARRDSPRHGAWCDQSRKSDRVSRSDRAGRVYRRPSTGHDLVSRSGLQRAEIAGAGVQLRAGHPRTAAASAYAATCWRGDPNRALSSLALRQHHR